MTGAHDDAGRPLFSEVNSTVRPPEQQRRLFDASGQIQYGGRSKNEVLQDVQRALTLHEIAAKTGGKVSGDGKALIMPDGRSVDQFVADVKGLIKDALKGTIGSRGDRERVEAARLAWIDKSEREGGLTAAGAEDERAKVRSGAFYREREAPPALGSRGTIPMISMGGFDEIHPYEPRTPHHIGRAADVVVFGEAPGRSEAHAGQPLVGSARTPLGFPREVSLAEVLSAIWCPEEAAPHGVYFSFESGVSLNVHGSDVWWEGPTEDEQPVPAATALGAVFEALAALPMEQLDRYGSTRAYLLDSPAPYVLTVIDICATNVTVELLWTSLHADDNVLPDHLELVEALAVPFRREGGMLVERIVKKATVGGSVYHVTFPRTVVATERADGAVERGSTGLAKVAGAFGPTAMPPPVRPEDRPRPVVEVIMDDPTEVP